jgi:uncharacterized damage-inducible protein DinB
MKSFAVLALIPLTVCAANDGTPSKSGGEFNKRWNNARQLAVAVAEAMPPAQYAFRPDPGSMSFGELMIHIAQANYAFGYGLKDSKTPLLPTPDGKEAIVKLLGDSFDYLSTVIANLTDDQLGQVHPSPDGRLIGRDILLAIYGHMAHHRGQAEVYLRIKGIVPPSYIF